tara:strand:+ start:95 stop:487 length:393 start_codon:yes stop_codon:yes gene_type:complete
VRRAQIARLTKLESLSLNCGHPRDGFKDGGDGIIQLVKQLPHLLLLRVQPFTAFGSFLGDWEFVVDCQARRLASKEGLHARSATQIDPLVSPAHRSISPSTFWHLTRTAIARTPRPVGPASKMRTTVGLT